MTDEHMSVSPGCDPVRITGFLDGALTAAEGLEIESHLALCLACRGQLEEERAVAAALRIQPPPSLPHGLAARVRRRSRRPVTLRRRVWVPSLAAMLLLVLVGRNAAQFVSWQVALDHAHCFGKGQVPAEVLTDDPMRLTAWFDAQGTELPYLPASAGGLDMVGGRYCRLLDRTAVHVYYGGGNEQLSLFVIPGSVHAFGDDELARGPHTVEILHVAGTNVALVSTDRPSIAAFRRALVRTIASGAAGRAADPAP